ncbi:SprT-like [Methylophilaceae bacterium]|jgi:predicted SprT family Zn-dependent metalloprotease
MNLITAKMQAIKTMATYGLTDWTFKFDDAVQRFGCCDYMNKTISLSRHLVWLNGANEVKNIILHEIAHALVGYRHGHDKVWKQKAIAIGCNGNRCYGSEVKAPTPKWRLECPTCGRITYRERKAKTLACGRCCSGKYDAKHSFIWRRHPSV